MFYRVPASLREVAALQCGVVTTAQLLEAGLTRDVLRGRADRARWQRLYRGVYAVFPGRPERPAQLWAAVLFAGPGAMLSHLTAAEICGLLDKPAQSVHVTVPSERRVPRAPGIVVHYSARASQALHPAHAVPQTRIEETVLDLASVARSLDDAVGWVTSALGRRLTTQAKLLEAVGLRAKVRWRRELTDLLSPDGAGIHSVLEYRYYHDVELPHGLPAATRQAPSRRDDRNEYRDRLYEQYLTAVELDGRLAHPSSQRRSDIRRDNAAAGAGIVTLRFGWSDVTEHPCQTAAVVAEALAARGFSGGRPCSPGCPVGRLARTYQRLA